MGSFGSRGGLNAVVPVRPGGRSPDQAVGSKKVTPKYAPEHDEFPLFVDLREMTEIGGGVEPK